MTEETGPVIQQAEAPYIVFCSETEESHFSGFVHEADMFLATLGKEVYEDRMSPQEARELWLPYRQFNEEIYDPTEWKDDPR